MKRTLATLTLATILFAAMRRIGRRAGGGAVLTLSDPQRDRPGGLRLGLERARRREASLLTRSLTEDAGTSSHRRHHDAQGLADAIRQFLGSTRARPVSRQAKPTCALATAALHVGVRPVQSSTGSTTWSWRYHQHPLQAAAL